MLFKWGISSNYNEPMTREQINRLSEGQLRTIFNNISATNNLVNIQDVKGDDLAIVNRDEYDYILTYSFPCQDLSLAGKGKGMSDTSTRSGMLWEVERILTECNELGTLPQILLMENVPQVHGESNDNYKDFNKWQLRLEELGYKNYWQDLIATDYGIPQTRNRCFMISILGEYNYTFPKPIPLKLKLKDMLEHDVDEKYYLSEKALNYVLDVNDVQVGTKWEGSTSNGSLNKPVAMTIGCRSAANQRVGITNYVIDNYDDEMTVKEAKLRIKNATKTGYLEATEGDGIDISSRMQHHRGTVQKGMIQTLDSQGGNSKGVVINSVYSNEEKKLFTNDGNIKRYVDSNIVDEFKEGQMATTSFPNGYGHGPRTHDECIALNTIDKPSIKQDLRIRKLTPRECFRLMGVKDEDFEKCAKNQSDSSLYHLAGDSLVTLVFCAIMSTMIDNCKTFEQVLEEFYLQISN